MEQVTVTSIAASYIADVREKDNYIAQLEDLGEAIGQAIYAMDNWKGSLKPDFAKILLALDQFRDLTVNLASTYDGK